MHVGGIALKRILTVSLIFANVLVYAYTSVKSGNLLETSLNVLETYGQSNSAVITQGWYWQLFTSMFVHVTLLHLIINMLFLLIFGLRAEELFEDTEFLFIYLASGFVGNLLTLLLPLSIVSAGTSGAIFGIFGASIIYIRKVFDMPVFNALIYSLLFLILSISEGVNFFAHLGGLAAGLVIGYFLAKSRKKAF